MLLYTPEKVRKEILNIDNNCYLSIPSLWEIAIKIKLEKFIIKYPFEKFVSYLTKNQIELIPISLNILLNY